jgi:Na+/H+-dicarboxylate symporter
MLPNLDLYTIDDRGHGDPYRFYRQFLAGMVMLVIVLGQAGIPEAGLALIFAIDRPLDMCRTVVNVTSDSTVATIVAKSVGKLHHPKDF